MTKRSYSDADFAAYVVKFRQENCGWWPNADQIVADLGGGKSTARRLLAEARAADWNTKIDPIDPSIVVAVELHGVRADTDGNYLIDNSQATPQFYSVYLCAHGGHTKFMRDFIDSDAALAYASECAHVLNIQFRDCHAAAQLSAPSRPVSDTLRARRESAP